MTLTITIFSLSLIGIVFMLINKLREIEKGRPYFKFTKNLDESIKNTCTSLWCRSKEFVKNGSKKALHEFVRKTFIALRKVKYMIYPHIEHIVKAVKGNNIPSEKSASSFFLVHIREHKKKIEASKKAKMISEKSF